MKTIRENLKLTGVWKFTIRDAKTGKIKRVYNFKNLIPTVGRTLLANNLTDASPDNDPRINYVAVGTNAAAPANSDTTLGTELERKAVSSEVNSNNIAYVTGFFTATEAVGSLKEAGLFCDGTGVADSGILFSHVAIDITKSGTETLTIDWTLTIN